MVKGNGVSGRNRREGIKEEKKRREGRRRIRKKG